MFIESYIMAVIILIDMQLNLWSLQSPWFLKFRSNVIKLNAVESKSEERQMFTFQNSGKTVLTWRAGWPEIHAGSWWNPPSWCCSWTSAFLSLGLVSRSKNSFHSSLPNGPNTLQHFVSDKPFKPDWIFVGQAGALELKILD